MFMTDAISLAIDYLNKKLKAELSSDYYTHIREWRAWWEGYVKPFHSYRELGLDNAPRQREMYRMGMAKRITEDWASLLLNEKTAFVVGDAASSAFLQGDDAQQGVGGVLGDNNFWVEGNELLEKAFAFGTGAFVVRALGAEADANGRIVANADTRIGIEYLDALSIIPLSVEHSRITEVAFVSCFTKLGKECLYIESHTRGENGNYVIENEYFRVENGALKPGEGDAVSTIDTGSPLPWFAIFTPNITNNIRHNNGMGISVYANAIDNLKGCDLAFNNFLKDFKLGGKKVFYTKSMLRTNAEGLTITPDDVAQQLFQQIGDDSNFDAQQMVQEFNPSLRVQENRDGLQAQLDYLCFKCGMGTHRYQFDSGGVKTATEYSGERQELVQHAQRHMIILESAIRDMCRAILYVGKTFCGAAVDPGTSIVVNFEDGFIIDDETARERDRQDMRDGLLDKWEYRVKWYGETEDEAKAAISAMSADALSFEE